MQIPTLQNILTNHDDVASIALILWDQAGRPAGRDLEFWLSAERRVRMDIASDYQLDIGQGGIRIIGACLPNPPSKKLPLVAAKQAPGLEKPFL